MVDRAPRRRWTYRSASKRLADAEVNTPGAARLPIHQQIRDGIQLPPEIEADGSNRRPVPKTGTDRVAQIFEIEVEGFGPDVAGVDEEDTSKAAAQYGTKLGAQRHHAVASNRQT